jgi:hypothetical protein
MHFWPTYRRWTPFCCALRWEVSHVWLDNVATLTSGHRRARPILASVPFGYRSPEQEETDFAAFRELLAG